MTASRDPMTMALLAGGAVVVGWFLLAPRARGAVPPPPPPAPRPPAPSSHTTTIAVPGPLQRYHPDDLNGVAPAVRADVERVLLAQLADLGYREVATDVESAIYRFLADHRLPNGPYSATPGQRYAWVATKVDDVFRSVHGLPAAT